jgi:hypothetical protein
MVAGFSLANYLMLVDYTGRLFRPGKASIPSDLGGVFERLGLTIDLWEQQQLKLSGGELKGRVLSSSRSRLREAAQQLGQRRCLNLNGCFSA